MSHEPPTFVSIPTHHTAPPQFKEGPPKPLGESLTPRKGQETDVPQADVPVMEFASSLISDSEQGKPEMPAEANPKPANTTKPSIPPEEESPEPPGSSNRLVEMPTPISWKQEQPSKSDKDKEPASTSKSSVSLVDNNDGVDQGASVVERVATLQDESGSGPVNPPLKPGAHHI